MAAVDIGVRDDVQPTANQKLDRFLTGTVTVLPFIALGIASWQVWNEFLHWYDLVAFLALYIPTGLGVTVGFPRLFTHRSFKTGPITRGVLAALGSIAIEGPVISWVADHRKHHAFSDEEGDPHSPHVDHGGLRGLFHAHVGWLFMHDQRALKTRYAPDLLKDPVVSWINRTFFFWAIFGFVVPFCIGFILGGTLMAGGEAPASGGGGPPGRRRHAHGGRDGPGLGRTDPHGRPAPRHVLDQLAVPRLRAARLRDRRRVAQPGLAGAAVVRRGLAQQPPRLPDVFGPRPEVVADRPLEHDHPRDGEARPRVGRRARDARRRPHLGGGASDRLGGAALPR